MSVNLEESLRWVEQVCQELNRNPLAATRKLEEFRDSNNALDICLGILQASAASSVAEFHLISSAKHALLFRWENLTPEYRSQWLQWIEGSLNTRISLNQPAYLLNKLMEVYVSIRKRSWLCSSPEEKDNILNYINQCLNNQNIPFQYMGATLLLYLIEEFNKTTSADLNVHISYYLRTKIEFETNSLPVLLSMAWGKLSQMIVAVELVNIFGIFPLLVKAVTDIVCWEYSSLHSNVILENSAHDEIITLIHKPPRLFAEIFLQPLFLDKIFELYKSFRMMQVQIPQHTEINNTILELKNLICAMSCINGEIFQSTEEKVQFANLILLEICLLSEAHATRRTLQLLTFESDDYEEGAIRYEELLLLLQVFSLLLGNFGLQVIVILPHFTPGMNLIGQVNVEMCSEIDCLTTDVRVRLQRSDFKDVAETGIINTWRFDVFTHCLDIWTTLQDHFSIICSSNVSSMQSGDVGMFRRWLMEISEKLFGRSFECVLMVLVNDCLAAAENMTAEETERIEERIVEGLLLGIAALGRLHTLKAINIVGEKLFAATNDFQSVYNLLNTHHDSLALVHSPQTGWKTKTLFCLENIRICVLILTFLLVDDFSMAEENSFVSRGGEAPVISTWILESLRWEDSANAGNDNSSSNRGGLSPVPGGSQASGLKVLFESFRFLTSLLQLQLTILTTPVAFTSSDGSKRQADSLALHPCASPLLLKCVLSFFAAIARRYFDPKLENYSQETTNYYPFLSNSFLRGPEINGMLEVLGYAFEVIVRRLPMETDTVHAAAECLRAVCYSCDANRILALLALPGIQQLAASYAYLLGSQQGAIGEASPLQRLTDEGIMYVTEAMGTLMIRAGHDDMFRALCQNLFTALAFLQSNNNSSNHNLSQAELNLSLGAIAGLVRCGGGPLDALLLLTNRVWEWMQWRQHELSSAMETARTCGELVRDFAEYQLERLGELPAENNQTGPFYTAIVTLLHAYATHLVQHRAGGLNIDEDVLLLLDILNAIADREFLLPSPAPEDFPPRMRSTSPLSAASRGAQMPLSPASRRPLTSESINSPTSSYKGTLAALRDLPSVLLFGIEILCPVITTQLLEQFPNITTQYANWLAYLTGACGDALFLWLQQAGPALGAQYLSSILQHLLVISVGLDAAAGRTALQAIQQLAAQQWQAIRGVDGSTRRAVLTHASLTSALQNGLVEMTRILLQSSSSKDAQGGAAGGVAHITNDRLDAFANAYLPLLLLHAYQRFHALLGEVMNQLGLSSEAQKRIVALVGTMLTDRELKLESIDKNNRMNFAQNLKDFLRQLRSLVTA